MFMKQSSLAALSRVLARHCKATLIRRVDNRFMKEQCRSDDKGAWFAGNGPNDMFCGSPEEPRKPVCSGARARQHRDKAGQPREELVKPLHSPGKAWRDGWRSRQDSNNPSSPGEDGKEQSQVRRRRRDGWRSRQDSNL
ncbi:MAG: hypothetical protein IOC59_05875 [Methylobacterium sp.]|nr:hypothetical protein [Methylobacterium sp.]